DIVGRVGALAEVASIIRHHHERVDGTGYPDGLAGEAIPPFARVISVVDAYEAMTAARAYRPALSGKRACQAIFERLGTQFDARVGQIFLSLSDLP
ncbi:MAG TPA: HD domain-containing phosphohydrolase, partial [Armatimonadota bacterium]|nr:HD domain-containing phosphohydrolase [Armatimonadota bacterium]